MCALNSLPAGATRGALNDFSTANLRRTHASLVAKLVLCPSRGVDNHIVGLWNRLAYDGTLVALCFTTLRRNDTSGTSAFDALADLVDNATTFTEGHLPRP